jgi:peptide/nickel transport system substrate-binding protein
MKLTLSPRLQSRPKTSFFARLINAIERKPMSDRLVLRVLFFAIIGSLVFGALTVNRAYLAATPVPGGTLTEGIVGIPRFLNPILAVTRADQDMNALLYSGLMKINTEGILVPDLAESVTMSDDGRTYNVVMRRDVRFHDDTPITARDVAFTIGLIQNPDLKSPLRGNWSGVTIEEISEYELNIVLDEPYTPFIENFTLGIIPRHIWNELPIEQIAFSQRNTEPVGSGPFKLASVNRNEAGLIDSYVLNRATDDVKLDELVVQFYQNEADLTEAFALGKITSTANLPLPSIAEYTKDGQFTLVEEPLPRVFGIFFNQNKSVALRDAAVREALELVIDRTAIVDEVLLGYGVPTASPIPPTDDTVHFGSQEDSNASTSVEVATTKLTKAGWQKNQNGAWEKRIDGNTVILSVTLRTANTSLFENTTSAIADAWRSLGIQVEVEQYEQSDLLQAVIRPRDFEALLFGIDMNRTVDLYPFWHSSQREDPGLNIAQYANIEVDALLTTARGTTSKADAEAGTINATNIIINERPAIFLFVPTLTYVVAHDVSTTPMVAISKPQDRFMNIETWHVAKEERWPIFR